MPEDQNSVAALRARLDHHAGVKARAEAERAGLIADRAHLGSLLNESETDEIDGEIARLSATIERAASRVELIRPAVERADRAETEAAVATEQRNSAALAAQDRAALAASSGDAVGDAETFVRLKAARAPVVKPSAAIFADPAPIRGFRDDAAWHAAREAKERTERAARIANRY